MIPPEPVPDMTGKTKVLIVDDHPIVREGLTRRINRQSDMAVCGEADGAAQALHLLSECQPDLVVVDLTLQDRGGLELIKDLQVRRPKLPILVLSMHDETVYAERALRAGAKGYIMKQEATDHVVEAIRRVREGGVYLSERMSARLLGTFVAAEASPAQSPVERLSDRELEVFQLIGQGQGSRQIAERLHVSIKTVDAYRANIKEKLNISSATELVHQAFLWVQKQMGA